MSSGGAPCLKKTYRLKITSFPRTSQIPSTTPSCINKMSPQSRLPVWNSCIPWLLTAAWWKGSSPSSGKNCHRDLGPEMFYASVYSSVNRESSLLLRASSKLMYVKHSLAGQIDIIIFYFYNTQIICNSFINFFHINIFVLNRPIHIYEI